METFFLQNKVFLYYFFLVKNKLEAQLVVWENLHAT